MTIEVQMTVSYEVALWLRDVILAAGVTEDPFSPMVGDVNQVAALRAVDTGISRCSCKPRVCLHCGAKLYVYGQGRPVQYCSDRCRVAAFRARKVKP